MTGLTARDGPPVIGREPVQAGTAGVIALFEELYRVHGGRMKSIAYRFLRNRSDAEDALQETFLKAYRGMAGYRGGAAFSTWCYSVLFNTCRDMVRRGKRIPESEPVDDRALHDARAENGDHVLRVTLERCLAELPFRSQAIFVLFEIEGFRHREIADILDIPEGTSKTLLFEAKKQLQKALWRGSAMRRRQDDTRVP